MKWPLALLLLFLSACSWLREPAPTPLPADRPNPDFPVVHVTADQVAQAMEQDRFYSDYGFTTLLIEGPVASVRRQGTDLIVRLDTAFETKVVCNLGGYVGIVRAGTTITVRSVYPQRDVSRQPLAVMIENCTIP